MTEERDVLEEGLRAMWNVRSDWTVTESITTAIRANPQAMFDLLVEAGCAEKRLGTWGTNNGIVNDPIYRPIPPKPPHEHDWRVNGRTQVWCGAVGHEGDRWHTVPLIPPDQMPKYEGPVPS